jgi:excisionase family DNA binding protein
MLTIEEVAKHWRLRPATVRLRIKSGELAAFRVGGRYRTDWPSVWSCEAGRRPTGAQSSAYKTPLLTKSDLARAMKVGNSTPRRDTSREVAIERIARQKRRRRASRRHPTRCQAPIEGE